MKYITTRCSVPGKQIGGGDEGGGEGLRGAWLSLCGGSGSGDSSGSEFGLGDGSCSGNESSSGTG